MYQKSLQEVFYDKNHTQSLRYALDLYDHNAILNKETRVFDIISSLKF